MPTQRSRNDPSKCPDGPTRHRTPPVPTGLRACKISPARRGDLASGTLFAPSEVWPGAWSMMSCGQSLSRCCRSTPRASGEGTHVRPTGLPLQASCTSCALAFLGNTCLWNLGKRSRVRLLDLREITAISGAHAHTVQLGRRQALSVMAARNLKRASSAEEPDGGNLLVRIW